MEYRATIGLEIHAELKTATKMFCRSKNDPFAAEPNTNICPVCLAHPGTLPVINREAVRHVLRVGTALGGKFADYTEFDRKNYFYPDLPKGYQISQYEYPLVQGGELAGVKVTRVHLEEDTASSIHNDSEGSTVIDYNRAGVPLMELVTEPVIRSSKAAGDFARELQLLLRYLGTSDANMEKGEMRVEANVSISEDDTLGTKVEIKNLNSFRIMEKAVEHEIQRQQELLERGEKIVQETRGWDDGKQSTFPQRTKEGSADYRYFPDPDLPSLRISEVEGFSDAALRATLPELPSSRRQRYLARGVKGDDADMFVREPGYGLLFDTVTAEWGKDDARTLLTANVIANNLAGLLSALGGRDVSSRATEFRAEMPMSAENLRTLVQMVAEKKVSSQAAKEILGASLSTGETPEKLATARGLFKMDDENVLEDIVGSVVSENSKVAGEYRAGKLPALQFLVGKAMKAARGAADPATVKALIEKKIAEMPE